MYCLQSSHSLLRCWLGCLVGQDGQQFVSSYILQKVRIAASLQWNPQACEALLASMIAYTAVC